MRKIRTTSTFSLSFLDIMSCGLGAAVLIFLLLRHNVDNTQVVNPKKTMAEINLLEEEIQDGEDNLARIRNTISEISDENVIAEGLARRIQEELDRLSGVAQQLDPSTAEEIAALEEKITDLEAKKETLEEMEFSGDKALQYVGEGQRQYLTGVKLGGNNVLILFDVSASMLDETVVNIFRRRNMSEQAKKSAPKWKRAISVLRWVLANLPSTSDYQVAFFNDEANPALANISATDGWRRVSDSDSLLKVIEAAEQIVPQNGTNLYKALNFAMEQTPLPDNIFIITDGLPTLGRKKARKKLVDGATRVRLFNRAIDEIETHIPVNTILLPLEGDPYAAAAFWRLAKRSRGSFLTPSKDWP